MIPIQMQLSQKQRTVSQYFAAFLWPRLNLDRFEQQYYPHRFCVSEMRDFENVVR